jgi:hypothetical protein
MLKEEHRWRMFKDRVSGIIFGPEREEVTGAWTELQNVEPHNWSIFIPFFKQY